MADEQREGPEKEKIYTFTERNWTLHLQKWFLIHDRPLYVSV